MEFLLQMYKCKWNRIHLLVLGFLRPFSYLEIIPVRIRQVGQMAMDWTANEAG